MTRLLIFPLILLFTHHAIAAEQAALKRLSIRIFAVALAKDQGPVCVMVGESRNPAFEIPTTQLSDPQSVTARDFILAEATTTPEAPPVALATIHLPEQGTDFRIILIPTANKSYKPVVIRGDDPKFSNGDFFFINLSTHDILGILGATKLDLKPGAQEMVKPVSTKSDKFFEVKIARREEGKLLPLTNTCWPIVKDNRSFVIFYNGENGRPTYRAVDEFMKLPGAS